jgi:hypothetical protein
VKAFAHAARAAQPFLAVDAGYPGDLGGGPHLADLRGTDALNPGALDPFGAGAGHMPQGLEAAQVGSAKRCGLGHAQHHGGDKVDDRRTEALDRRKGALRIELLVDHHAGAAEQGDLRKEKRLVVV